MSGGSDNIADGAFDTDMGFVGSPEPSREDCMAQLLLMQPLAGRRYIREQR